MSCSIHIMFDFNDIILNILAVEGYKNVHFKFILNQFQIYESRKDVYEDYIMGGGNTNITIIELCDLAAPKYIVIIMKNNSITHTLYEESTFRIFYNDLLIQMEYCSNIDKSIEFFKNENETIQVYVKKISTSNDFYHYFLSDGRELENLN